MPKIVMKIVTLLSRGLRLLFTLPILIYQYAISPLLPGVCIYSPSCSHYARQAILRHGILKGPVLALSRISRCAGGLFIGGEDPVPERFSFREIGRKYRDFRPPRR
jgi:hypothetical protein